MSRVNKTVRYYTIGAVDIFFPEDRVCCNLCPLLETYARRMCRKTGEYLYDGQVIGARCPLTFREEDAEKTN